MRRCHHCYVHEQRRDETVMVCAHCGHVRHRWPADAGDQDRAAYTQKAHRALCTRQQEFA